jgi:hypothetical protein
MSCRKAKAIEIDPDVHTANRQYIRTLTVERRTQMAGSSGSTAYIHVPTVLPVHGQRKLVVTITPLFAYSEEHVSC